VKKNEFGSGFSVTNLKLMRQFYIEYRPRMGQTASGQSSHLLPIGQTVSDPLTSTQKQQTPSVKLAPARISVTASRKSPFTLSWSHYVELTLPKDANIHAREYQLCLPSKELLQAKLLEWVRAAGGRS